MLKNLDELMMKMCASDNDGVGVEVDGLIYFYEDFGNDDGIGRAYRHFGTDKPMTFYSMAWARQRRIKEFMNLYKTMRDNHETERADGLAKVITKYIVKWGGCSNETAVRQIETMQVSYIINRMSRNGQK